MRSELSIRLRRGADGRVSASGALAVAPYWCRWDGDTLWLVGSAATPVARDDVVLELQVDAGVVATVRSVAASIVYAGRGEGTRLHTSLSVGSGAVLRWQPEPIIVTERARHVASTVIDVADGGAVLADELLMLGRLDERPGAMRTSLELRRDGVPFALTGVDTELPGWDGPGGTGGAKVVGTRVVVDPPERVLPVAVDPPPTRSSAVLRPSGGGAIATALADDPAAALARLDATLDLGAG